MISDVYKIDGKYPDPYEIEKRLEEVKGNQEEYKKSLKEVKDSGMHAHPALDRFFR